MRREPLQLEALSGGGRTLASRRILASAATGISSFIAAHGGDPLEIFHWVGLDRRTLEDKRGRLDLGEYVEMLEYSAQHTGVSNFGLVYGRQFQPEMLGLIGELPLAAPTLGGALEFFARWFPWHQQATETKFVRHDDYWHLTYRILDGSIIDRRQDAELTMGMFINVIRACLGAGWRPELICFEHPRPDFWQQHHAILDTEIAWSQSTNAIVFKDQSLDQRMPGADPVKLARIADELRRITGSCGALTVVDHARGRLRYLLAKGTPGIDEVADACGMHRWTFQRRLAEEGANFSQILEFTRQNLAEHYLGYRYLDFSEIAFLLGYSEQSAFSRAFKKWNGLSPRKYRQNNLCRPV